MRPFILGVDWNSTLEDQIAEIRRQALTLYGAHLSASDFAVWDAPLGAKCGISDDEFTRWAWTDPSIQDRALPYPGVVEMMQFLATVPNLRVHIISSTSNPALLIPWLERHEIPADRVITDQSKDEAEFDLLLDDSPTTLERLHLAGRQVWRHALAWNEHLSYIRPVRSWYSVPGMLPAWLF